ncbi:protein kinase [Empedobacter falsenii]
MDFNFPKYFFIDYGTLKKKVGNDSESIDIYNPIENTISINSIDYYFIPLSENGNKGGNSIILKLYESQNFDIEILNYDTPDKVLKISKRPLKANPDKFNKRFNLEIEALDRCSKKGHQNIITTFENGICKIYNYGKNKYYPYQFYTMEFAEYDLKSYIEKNHETLSFEQKIELCISLSQGLKELDELGYYHRDLKPDNIFITEQNVWKIGDLGLLENREIESIDNIAEFIGPRGWMTPEAMNKYLCESKGFEFKHNCIIDHQSDIFQLGKIFWYIFQFNAPIGTVKENDFLIKNSQLFSIIKTMLNHSKKKRYKNIDEVINLLKPLESQALLK